MSKTSPQPRFTRLIQLNDHVQAGKVLILYGARQVGKTTLVKQFLAETSQRSVFHTGDDRTFAAAFGSCDLHTIKGMVQGIDLLVIDEAQKIDRIGTALKLVVDHVPQVAVIATGSSSFDLANAAEEPLTGRKNVLTLYPLSFREMTNDLTPFEASRRLQEWMIYGAYPEVVALEGIQAKQDRISEIADSYLIKDILEFQLLKRSKVLVDLLRLLAFQIGGLVSTTELGRQLGLDNKTVQRYLDLLEKSFVIVPLHGFSRNLRKELTKMSKYYFMDLGIRNALIANFNPLPLRDDLGALWENFMILERLKWNVYAGNRVNRYYWRTYDHKEVDLVEESAGRLRGYEFKWSPSSQIRAPKSWLETYPEATWELITPDNFQPLITP